MPKIVDYDSRRTEIAAMAVKVFVRDGYHAANLSDIAELCGFGRTTIYKYFTNKSDIYVFAMEDIFKRLKFLATEVLENRSLGPTDRLLLLLDKLLRKAVEEKELMTLVIEQLLCPERRDPHMNLGAVQMIRDLRASLESLLVEGNAAGELKVANPNAMAFALFSLVEAATINNSLYSIFSLEDTLHAAKDLVTGLRARQG